MLEDSGSPLVGLRVRARTRSAKGLALQRLPEPGLFSNYTASDTQAPTHPRPSRTPFSVQSGLTGTLPNVPLPNVLAKPPGAESPGTLFLVLAQGGASRIGTWISSLLLLTSCFGRHVHYAPADLSTKGTPFNLNLLTCNHTCSVRCMIKVGVTRLSQASNQTEPMLPLRS